MMGFPRAESAAKNVDGEIYIAHFRAPTLEKFTNYLPGISAVKSLVTLIFVVKKLS